jgi:hypothetical protein
MMLEFQQSTNSCASRAAMVEWSASNGGLNQEWSAWYRLELMPSLATAPRANRL